MKKDLIFQKEYVIVFTVEYVMKGAVDKPLFKVIRITEVKKCRKRKKAI